MSSYQLDPQYDASKVLYINSRDADAFLENNNFGRPLSTNFLYTLTEKLNISENQMALLSLYSATIPHSFFNVRDGVNDIIPMYIECIDGQDTPLNKQVNIKLDDGNYDTASLITQFYNGNVDFQTSKYEGFKSIAFSGTATDHSSFTIPITDILDGSDPSGGDYPFITYNEINNCFRFQMVINAGIPNVIGGVRKIKSIKITFNFLTAPTIGSQFTNSTDLLANAIFGFSGLVDFPNKADQVEPESGNFFYVAVSGEQKCWTQSQQVIDLNDNIHGLMLRTNLVSKGTLSSNTSIFSNILARIPISTIVEGGGITKGDAQQGGMIYFNPSQATHQNLVDLSAIDVIGVRLTDDKDRTIDLNGLDFQIAILLQYVNHPSPPPTKKPLIKDNTKKDIKNKPTTKTSKK
mgnify:FL=1|tara:strand:- start:519 stop:1739 length:1221 start_codon:yes stop_codon:yes gene_type:complete